GQGDGECEMPLRMFQDDGGREWRVWEVRPLRPERRATDRRLLARAVPLERRRGSDRRVLAETRVKLSHGLTHGWLAFDSDAEKRRLAPIPMGWDALPDRVLEALCRAARATDRRNDPSQG
ncbi:MAG TPA: hypothetical protein VEA99_15140, partial [Gemmatimonadaceae bacterium]|nr:hypothetical protein [Gemmatimonadaceae bacterium]